MIALHGKVHIDRLGPRFAAVIAGDGDCRGSGLVISTEYVNGALIKDIGNKLRFDIANGGAINFHVDIGKHWCSSALDKPLRGTVGLLCECYVLSRAAPFRTHRINEIAVDSITD